MDEDRIKHCMFHQFLWKMGTEEFFGRGPKVQTLVVFVWMLAMYLVLFMFTSISACD
jgi:hypothetical protein